MPGSIEIIQGDITRLAVDGIVNAANESLLGGGGVDGAIHRAAGPKLLEDCRALPEITPNVRCPTGEAKITRGHDLPAKFVIHTAGPVWRGGKHDEDETLARCYRNCFRLAAAYNLSSLSLPAISTGAYGFPLERAARIAVRETREYLKKDSSLERVLLVCFDHDAKRAFERALQDAEAGDDDDDA
jgi:O-acetyl-ADP-ribose deacetylase (regulator of RNase III)